MVISGCIPNVLRKREVSRKAYLGMGDCRCSSNGTISLVSLTILNVFFPELGPLLYDSWYNTNT